MSDLVITNSLVKAFKSCQNATKYQYVDLLGPKLTRSKPLKRGIWFHELLEAKYKGESVQAVHAENTAKYAKLLDEEKEVLGDLPTEMADLYRSYAWYYQNDPSWIVHEVEIKIEATLPNGQQGQGKADMLVEDEYGDLWAVDHKTHLTLPTWDYRLLDPQCPYYIWLFRQNKIPVKGFIWNYVVPKGPKPLKFNLNGALSKVRPAITDFPTVDRHLTPEQRDMPEVQEILAKLYLTRYDRDTVQTSPVFRRDTLEPDESTIDLVIQDICTTGTRYEGWYKKLTQGPTAQMKQQLVTRTVSRSCEWCDFRRLCVAELTGQNAEGIRHREFTKRDPFDYYDVKPVV